MVSRTIYIFLAQKECTATWPSNYFSSSAATRLLLLQYHQRNATEYRDGRQYQAQCQGLAEKYDAAEGRYDRDTELHCRSLGGFQRW
jgi:hypothetical protein